MSLVSSCHQLFCPPTARHLQVPRQLLGILHGTGGLPTAGLQNQETIPQGVHPGVGGWEWDQCPDSSHLVNVDIANWKIIILHR